MDPYQLVADKLTALNIDFQLVEHEPALTTEQADQFNDTNIILESVLTPKKLE